VRPAVHSNVNCHEWFLWLDLGPFALDLCLGFLLFFFLLVVLSYNVATNKCQHVYHDFLRSTAVILMMLCKNID